MTEQPDTAAPLKAAWEGNTTRGGYDCPIKGCGRRMNLKLLDEHLSSPLFGGHGLQVKWTIRVCEVPDGT